MPSPSAALSTQRPDLSAAFEAFDLAADQAGYIGTRVAPVIEVAKPQGNFGKIPLAQLLQQRDTKHAPGSGYSRGNFTFDPATFRCEEWGAEEVVDDREATMYSEYFDAEMVATRRAFNAVLRSQEERWAAALFNATTWTGAALTTAITNEWDDAANAVPLTDVEAAVRKVYDGSGLWPNALICNRRVFRNLRNVNQIVERVKYQGFVDVRAGNITAEALAQAFDLKYIIVAGGSKNSAIEGQAATPTQIWSDEYAMVAKVCETSDPKEPGVARTFHFAGDGSALDGRVESYRDEPVRGDVIRVRHDVDEVVMYVQAAHLLSNITT
jgi:hypothetical protein